MKKIVFMGTPDFSVPILKHLIEHGQYEIGLVVTQPDRPKGRKRILTPPPVKVEAEKYRIPVFQPEKLKDDFKPITEYGPDLIITAAFGQILPKPLLDLPTYGCINVHASLLPELRGGAPIHYAIIQGKTETGITIMYMAEKLDAGDILAQRSVPIGIDDHVGTLHDALSEVGKDLLLETIPKIFAKEIIPVKQDEDKATFAANIKREQEKIDWTRTSEEIYNQIRGLHPWPVAFTTYENKRIKIWWAELMNKHYNKEPGEIVEIINKESFVVVCGNGKGLKITEIQPAGKKRMTVKQFLQGSSHWVQIGVKLGVEK